MIKQIVLPIVAVALFIIAVGIFSQKASSLNLTQLIATPTPAPTKNVTIGNQTLKVDIVNTPELRNKGLSGHSSLAEDYGMLFVFETKKVSPGFWMKDMKVPIDIIWIRDGYVEKIDSDAQPPAAGTPDAKLKLYSASRPIDYVLEVKSGFAKKYGVKVGDSITLPDGI